ncbi:UxaA family hydrolase [Endozoicomonas sp. Mp262]|uniref:UxaA family hydrolase n=1 Tax=Endozoicomonas sp. Mp262 TaxID=2919499 RepID=UPI0021DAE7D5
MIKAIRLTETDNVATLLEDAGKGDDIHIISHENEVITTVNLLQAIPFGNKVALKPFVKDDELIKGGCPVGKAICPIPIGQLVHVQNIRSLHLDIPEPVIQEIIKQMGIEENA